MVSNGSLYTAFMPSISFIEHWAQSVTSIHEHSVGYIELYTPIQSNLSHTRNQSYLSQATDRTMWNTTNIPNLKGKVAVVTGGKYVHLTYPFESLSHSLYTVQV